MPIICRLEPIDSDLPPVFLPDQEELVLGRQRDFEIKNTYCSRRQISVVANYTDKKVKVTNLGRAISVVNGIELQNGDSKIAHDGNIIEIVQGCIGYKVHFFNEYVKPVDSPVMPKEAHIEKWKPGGSSKDYGVQPPAKMLKASNEFQWRSLVQNHVFAGTAPHFESHRVKVASFDLDGTLIKTKSGRVFPKTHDDWMLWSPTIVSSLKELNKTGYKIIIFTNQASLSAANGLKRLDGFKMKMENIIKSLEVPISVYISASNSYYRKPCPGMWELMVEESLGNSIDMAKSFYVGDAAGRPAEWKPGCKADFAASDRYFAKNVGIKFYTPEEFFLREGKYIYPPEPFNPGDFDDGCTSHDLSKYKVPSSKLEVIIMVGAPGSGKSSFVKNYLIPNGYHMVSRDVLGTWQKCHITVKKLLEAKKHVVIDNTNPDSLSRKRFVDLCKEQKVKARCFIMRTKLDRCYHNNKFRQLTNPKHAVVAPKIIDQFFGSLEEPKLEEGFSEIVEVPFIQNYSSFSSHEKKLYNYIVGSIR